MNDDNMEAQLLRAIAREFERHDTGPLACYLPGLHCSEVFGEAGQYALVTLSQPPSVWGMFMERIATRTILELRRSIEMAAKRCESPMEELLFLALMFSGQLRASESAAVSTTREPAPFEFMDAFRIQPQFVVGRYRVDFEVSAYLLDETAEDEMWHTGAVLVEVDGHDFHERTKEQASHDKRKDRALQAAGFDVYRYTGSDVWNHCISSAEEIIAAAIGNAKKAPPVVTQPKRART